MRKLIVSAFIISSLCVSAQSNVYFISEITPESLVKVYEALGVEPKGKVAVKISTGESSRSNYLRPEFNVYDLKGNKVLDKAKSLESLEKGVYIVNSKKQIVN